AATEAWPDPCPARPVDAALEPRPSSSATEPSTTHGSPTARRVLVIEDNVDGADSLREILELEGHVVDVAYDGPTGLEKARRTRPEVVLCDLGLPGLDGYGVARALRQEPWARDRRLVALTGYALPEDRRRTAEAGFDLHLSKPPSLDDLRLAVCAT
ncbi:response regulator, partial [Myxococcota bacterium]|nr:response regulator [Myxococcota bacterium]